MATFATESLSFEGERLILVGTYGQDLGFVKGQGQGVYALRLSGSGRLTAAADKGPLLKSEDLGMNPSYMCASPTHPGVVYVTDERCDLEGGGRVTACRVSFDGSAGAAASPTAAVLGPPVAAGDTSTCHVSASTGGRGFVANYCGGGASTSGSAAALRVDAATAAVVARLPAAAAKGGGFAMAFPRAGEAGVVPERQDTGHCHMALLSGDESAVLCRAGKGREIPSLKGSYLGRLPLVSAEFWTRDHLSERSRRVNVCSWNTHVEATLNHPFPAQVLCPDLGADAVFRFDASDLAAGAALCCRCAPGDGPRHAAFHPTLDVLYVLCELSSRLLAFAVDRKTGAPLASGGGTGGAELLGAARTLPDPCYPPAGGPANAPESTCAALRVHPNGRFAYCSNRAVGVEGLLTRFDLDPLTGAPEEDPVHLATGGITPRDVNFAGPNADFLLAANQDSNTIVAFRVDPDSGALTKAHSVRCPTPVCLLDLGCPAANAA